MKIIAITVVTAQGVSQFRVGENNITNITEETKQVGEYNYLYFYKIHFKNEDETIISAICPLVIEYQKN